MSLLISTAHRAARNQASITLADTGPNPSSIKLYSERNGTLMAVRTLAKPCGTITAEGDTVKRIRVEVQWSVGAAGSATGLQRSVTLETYVTEH